MKREGSLVLHSKNEFSSTICTQRGEEREEGMGERRERERDGGKRGGGGNRMRGAGDAGGERESKAQGGE